MNQLPDKMSDLLDLALDDLEKVEKDPRYAVNMSYWHTGLKNGRLACEVCLAGSVLAKTLQFPTEEYFHSFSHEAGRELFRNKLFALDDLRTGDVAIAAKQLGISLPPDADFDREITTYRESPEDFKDELRELVKDLREAGL